jgi:hypothetical protein
MKNPTPNTSDLMRRLREMKIMSLDCRDVWSEVSQLVALRAAVLIRESGALQNQPSARV